MAGAEAKRRKVVGVNIDEAKEILLPLCPQQADGRPLSPGFCDQDLIAIATHIREMEQLLADFYAPIELLWSQIRDGSYLFQRRP